MASVAPEKPPAEFWSAAQLAEYSGLSLKTVRRLVDAGKLRGYKVGRRVLIPPEDLFRLMRRKGRSPMSTAQQAPPRGVVDAQGRLIPMTEEEVRAAAPAIARGLDTIDDMGDPDEQRATLDALMAGLDEDRPSHRKLFP
jgi:excisionase family DNA binding protein